MKLIIEGYDFLKIFDTLCGQINLLKKLIKKIFNLKKIIKKKNSLPIWL